MHSKVDQMKTKLICLKGRRALFALGLLLGAMAILVVRFFAYMPEHVHYHANFAVYSNGKREEFKAPQYYQEVAICSANRGVTIPQQRAHMHEDINSVIHVHDHAVTWGQFFENLGWYIGPDFLQTDEDRRYLADGTSRLNIIIDGQDYTDLSSITNVVIKDKSRLLVSFGSTDQKTLQAEYGTVAKTAANYDVAKDPASCSGHEAVTTQERFKHLFK